VIRSFQGKFYTELISISGENMEGEPEQMQRDVLEKCTEKFPSEYLDVVRHADLSSFPWRPKHQWFP
jgi:hypothetical protein